MTIFTPWYEKDPKRYKKEKKLIHKFYPNSNTIISPYGTLLWKGSFSYQNKEHYFFVEFPEIYPFLHPFFWEYDPKCNFPIDHFQTTHQYRDTSLCLFTTDGGPESWHQSYLGIHVIEKFKQFLKKEDASEHVDEHTSIQYEITGFPKYDEIYLPTSEIIRIPIDQTFGFMTLYSFKDKRPAKLLVLENSNNILNQIPWEEIIDKNEFQKGIFLKIPFNKHEFRGVIKEYKDLTEFLIKNFNIKLDVSKTINFILLIFSNSEIPDSKTIKPSDFNPHYSYLYDLRENVVNFLKIPFYKVYSINIPSDCFQRTLGVLERVINNLHEKKVMIVGLGTLGSFVALELAKTGIQKFVLYDFDKFQAVNVCRHIGDLLDIGKYKTELVKEKILLRNPNADITIFEKNPYINYTNIEEFKENFKECDLVINTTVNYYAEHFINYCSFELKKNAIYAWCGANANQGRIFRVIPDQTPCYNCVDIRLEHEPNKYPRIENIDTSYTIPQFIGYRQPGIPGISVDISFIALFISKLSIQTLLRDYEEYPDALAHHYIWQNIPSEIDQQEFSLIPFHFERVKSCNICGVKK